MGPSAGAEFEAVARLKREEAALDEQLERARAEAREIVARADADASRALDEARRALEAELAQLREAAALKLEGELAAAHQAGLHARASLEKKVAGRRERAIELVVAQVLP
jgi:hypothetical protein